MERSEKLYDEIQRLLDEGVNVFDPNREAHLPEGVSQDLNDEEVLALKGIIEEERQGGRGAVVGIQLPNAPPIGHTQRASIRIGQTMIPSETTIQLERARENYYRQRADTPERVQAIGEYALAPKPHIPKGLLESLLERGRELIDPQHPVPVVGSPAGVRRGVAIDESSPSRRYSNIQSQHQYAIPSHVRDIGVLLGTTSGKKYTPNELHYEFGYRDDQGVIVDRLRSQGRVYTDETRRHIDRTMIPSSSTDVGSSSAMDALADALVDALRDRSSSEGSVP